jgi:predicted O-linked N-acetylglucosamine transferase (SPINDLY family)
MDVTFWSIVFILVSTFSPTYSLSSSRLRLRGDSAWKRALDSPNASAAAKATREAHSFYSEAYQSASLSDPIFKASCFYEAAYTSAVGALIEEQPLRSEVSTVLQNELKFTAKRDCSVTAESHDAAKSNNISSSNCFGHSQISQLVALSMLDAKDILLVSKAWASDRSVDVKGKEVERQHAIQKRPNEERMRVGFISTSFGDHPVGHHITPLLLYLNRSSFEVFCFYSPINGRIDKDISFLETNKAACDTWIELKGERNGEKNDASSDISYSSSEKSARLISNVNLNVLISIDGFDKGNRMDILSLRPTNCVYTFFGYLGTSGTDYIDGIIADEISIPSGDEVYYSERFILRHPVTFFVNNYRHLHAEIMQVNEMTQIDVESMQSDHSKEIQSAFSFSFCSFSQLFKVSRDTANAWISIMQNTSNSTKLVLLGYPPTGMPNLEQYFQSKGIGHRIEFLPILPRNQHLLRKRELCSLGLDTFYYNGHTTVSDLLWAGVPVLTFAAPNAAMAGKAAASLIKAAGAPKLFYGALSIEEYIQRAIDIERAYMRKMNGAMDEKVRKELFWRPSQSSELFQTEKWVRGFEEVLRDGEMICIEGMHTTK